ncbi:copper transport protein ctr1 [Ceratobasidium sp. 395]|nr:copper transport protein ctr1 [Ceratobasidium sp. 395]
MRLVPQTKHVSRGWPIAKIDPNGIQSLCAFGGEGNRSRLLPFARFDEDPALLKYLRDLNVPALSNVIWELGDEYQGFRGGFSYVERASWNGQDVAVKFLKQSYTSTGSTRVRKSLRRELRVVCVDNVYLGMVSPYMSNGSAPQYLSHNLKADILGILYDVAKGLEHLATQTPPIAHGDLKGVGTIDAFV